MNSSHCHTEEVFEPASFDEVLHDLKINNLKIVVNSRMKRSWNVKINTLSNYRTLTIPSYLHDAPFNIKKALIEWSVLPQKAADAQKRLIAIAKHDLEKIIQHYITTNHSVQSHRRLNMPTNTEALDGIKYNLKDIFDTVNKEYFNDELAALLRWGKLTSGTSYQMTQKISHGDPVNIITIAGCYNHTEIPRFAIEAVMFHEMLHIKIPPYKKNGKNVIHGPEFKHAEKLFRYYKEWRIWEKEHLRDIVRLRRRKRY